MWELLKNEMLDLIKDTKPKNKMLDLIDNVKWPFYDSKIVKSYEWWLLRKDTVMTTYYEVNWTRISENEYKIYMEKWMKWVYDNRKNEREKKEEREKGNLDDLLRKLD